MIYKLGCIRDLPDHRDFKCMLAAPEVFPPHVDLSPHMPKVYDQGQLGSCTANAIAGAFEYELLKENLQDWMPSRLMIYYQERVLENTINSDAGAQLRDGLKVIANTGVCQEAHWPYVISQFAVKPPNTCYQEAKHLHHHALQYRSVMSSVQDVKTSVVHKNPVIIGFVVYESFYNIGHDGMMPMPKPGERVEGGHATLIVGYDDARQCFLVRNSWGPNWGQHGYFWMPYAFVTSPYYTFDFWNISKV